MVTTILILRERYEVIGGRRSVVGVALRLTAHV